MPGRFPCMYRALVRVVERSLICRGAERRKKVTPVLSCDFQPACWSACIQSQTTRHNPSPPHSKGGATHGFPVQEEAERSPPLCSGIEGPVPARPHFAQGIPAYCDTAGHVRRGRFSFRVRVYAANPRSGCTACACCHDRSSCSGPSGYCCSGYCGAGRSRPQARRHTHHCHPRTTA